MLRLFTLIALDKQELALIELERHKVDSLIQAVEIRRLTDHKLDSLRADNERLQLIMQRYQEQIDSLNALNMELEAIQQEEVRTGRYKIAEYNYLPVVTCVFIACTMLSSLAKS